MPKALIDQFEKEYPGRGKQVFYATMNKQGRNPETGKKLRRRKTVREALTEIFGS